MSCHFIYAFKTVSERKLTLYTKSRLSDFGERNVFRSEMTNASCKMEKKNIFTTHKSINFKRNIQCLLINFYLIQRNHKSNENASRYEYAAQVRFVQVYK